MKKQFLCSFAATTLLATTLFNGSFVFATENDEHAISNAKITFTGENTDPVNPVDPDDPDNHGTDDNGPLSIDYVSNISFGTQEISSSNQVYSALNAEPHVQITDKRGVEGGWELTAATSKFTATDDSELKGAVLTFKNGEARTKSDNTSGKPAVNEEITFNNTDAQDVMTAASLAGEGTWLDVFPGEEGHNTDVQLVVPSGSAQAKEYTATITWTLTAGPSDANE
ncbi:WxL domain-containing protein [Enterococcus ratti]|uniref:WxL domain-containing protein n=1 Tax=Enterococcus ratti TaxID=150033 RepID=UPI003516EEBF